VAYTHYGFLAVPYVSIFVDKPALVHMPFLSMATNLKFVLAVNILLTNLLLIKY